MNDYEIVIVGAGISGATLAERFASVFGKKVLVIEKRDHIGGNCHDFVNDIGILVPKYGPHFFHTNDEEVWHYVNQFCEWRPYEHHHLSKVDETFVPLPVTIKTINLLFSLDLKNRTEMEQWLLENTTKIKNPVNSEEIALNKFGPLLYEKLFKYYIKKQWDIWPAELEPEVMLRQSLRLDNDERYFTDSYQGMPTQGYTKFFEKMLVHPNITVLTKTDYFTIKEKIPVGAALFFTGRIDDFFGPLNGQTLQYRSMIFKSENIDQEYYQPGAVVSHPAAATPFTRVTEPKYFNYSAAKQTTIIKEFPTWEGEPYYPVPNQQNRELYFSYQRLAEELESQGIYFVGRLANYKYFNMDQAFRNALDLFARVSVNYKI